MADLSVIYSKTPKGLRARTSLIGGLSSHLMRVLVHIDGNSKAETILVKFDHLTQQDLMADLAQLEHEGYIRPATITRPNTQDWAPTVNFTPMVVEEYQSEEEIEAKARAEAEAKEKEKAEAKVKAQLEAEAKAREAEEAKKKAEAEQKAKAEQAAKLEAERKTKAEAEAARQKAEQKAREEAEARLEAERKAKAEQKAREEAEQKAKAEQETRLEAERKAKAEMKAREEAEQAKAKAEAEAKENARRELERIGREAEEAQKKTEAEQKARVEAEARLEAERKAEVEEDARIKAEQKAQERAEKARTKAEADEKSKEEKERARLEIARVIREAEEARKKSEAEAKEARQEAKRKTKADEEAQIKAEHKAKLDAEQALTQAEDDEKARAEAYEKASLEMQRIGREAEEERSQSAEKVNVEANEEAARVRASVEAEDKAKAETKERARLEMERIAQEAEEERKKSAIKARAKSAEKTKADAESSYEVEYINGDDDDDDWDDDEIEEKTREVAKLIKGDDKVEDDVDDIEAIEKARQEAEELILEEAKLVAKEEAAEEAKLRAEARARAWFATTLAIKRWIPKAIKATLIYVPLLALLLIGIMHFINLSMLAEPIEKLASESIGEPVTINEVRASLWPAPHFKLGNVVIGDKPGQKIEFVNVVPEASTLFEEVKVMQSVEIEGLVVEPENFGQPQQWINSLGKAKHLKVAQVNLKKIVIKIRDLELEPLEGKVGFTESHELKSINLNSADNAFAMELTPLGSSFDVVLNATYWSLPVNPKIVFEALKAKGIVNQGRVDFSQMNGEIYGGKFTANAVVDWSYRWVVSGDFNIFRANVSPMLKAFASGISIDGKLNLIGNFACNAAEAARLVDVPDVTANFDLSGGKINGINLESAVLTRGSQSLAGDSTQFDKLTGSLQLSGGHYQYRKLVLEAPQFRAQGNVDIMPNQDITGKLNTSLAAQSRRLSSSFALTGKVGDVRRQ